MASKREIAYFITDSVRERRIFLQERDTHYWTFSFTKQDVYVTICTLVSHL